MLQTASLRSCHLCPPLVSFPSSREGRSQCRDGPPSPRRWHICSRQDLGACVHHSPTGFVPCSQGFRAGRGSRKPYKGPRKDWVVEWRRINKNPALTCLLSPNHLLAPGGQALAFLPFVPSCLCHVSPSVLHMGVGSKKGKENRMYVEEGRHLAQTELWETRGGGGCWRRRQDQNAGLRVPVLA